LVLAGEGAALWLTGGLATLLVNVGARVVLEVQDFMVVEEVPHLIVRLAMPQEVWVDFYQDFLVQQGLQMVHKKEVAEH
jgi:hypothetical protein